MKNSFLAAVALLSTLNIVQATKSEAGLLVGAIAGDAGKGASIGALVGATGMALYGTISYLTQDKDYTTIALTVAFTPIFAGLGALLDIDASVNEDALASGLKIQYPFINSAESIRELARVAKIKLHESAVTNPEAQIHLVKFTKMEIAQALSGTAISIEQLNQVAADLE